MQNQDPIAAAIAAAMQVSAQVPMTQAAPPAQAVAAYAPPLPAGRARTMEDALNSAGASVDAWLSIEASGYRLGTKIFESIKGKIPFSEVTFPYMCRASIGGATKFFRSYDGVREARSNRPWTDVLQQAQAMDPKCQGQYDAAEIPLILDADLVAGDKTIPAGSRVGITTPVTGYRPFASWLKQQQAVYGTTGIVPVIASVETKTKSGVKPWGVPQFTTIS